jgi:molecular chaperone DnaK (HSP70)
VFDSLSLSSLKSYKIISEDYTIPLHYGFYKASKSEFTEEKEVMFVNVGHTNTNVIIAKFSNNGFTILKKSNCSIGGENLTIRLYDHINAIIFKKYSINISEYPKKKFIVLKECEKAKKILSANSNAYINIDCLFDDMTINEKIDRKQFEILTNNIILQIVNTVNDCLIDYDINNLDSIELLGGAMTTSNTKSIFIYALELALKIFFAFSHSFKTINFFFGYSEIFIEYFLNIIALI